MNNTKLLVAGGVVCVVAVGGLMYVSSKKKVLTKKEVETDFVIVQKEAVPTPPKIVEAEVSVDTKVKPSTKAANPSPQQPLVETQPQTEETVHQSSSKATSNASFNRNSLNDSISLSSSLVEEHFETLEEEDGSVVFPEIGVKIMLGDWTFGVQDSSIPTLFMVTLHHRDFPQEAESQQHMPGDIPALVLTVEDISTEGLDLMEFKQRSKIMAREQLAGMTNGMVLPEIKMDGEVDIGPFKACLQYEVAAPFFHMSVLNLITVQNGLAFCLQFLGNPSMFERYSASAMEIARSFKIVPVRNVALSYQIVQIKTRHFSVHLPSNWVVHSVSRDATTLVVAHTPSPTKTEIIEILHSAQGDWSVHSMEQRAKADRGTAIKIRHKNGVIFASYKNHGAHVVMLVAHGQYCIKAVPLHNHVGLLIESDLVKVLESIKSTAPEYAHMYKNVSEGFSLNMKIGSRLIEPKVSRSTIVYAPEGMSQDAPTPSGVLRWTEAVESEAESSLDHWMAKFKQQSKQNPNAVVNLKYETIKGVKMITFEQHTESPHGLQIVVKVYFLLCGKRSYIWRWEVPQKMWKKYADNLTSMMESFRVGVTE
eukprot:PhF_6_TR4469/c0_g1_i1/m.6112